MTPYQTLKEAGVPILEEQVLGHLFFYVAQVSDRKVRVGFRTLGGRGETSMVFSKRRVRVLAERVSSFLQEAT